MPVRLVDSSRSTPRTALHLQFCARFSSLPATSFLTTPKISIMSNRTPYEYPGQDELTRKRYEKYFIDSGYDVNNSLPAETLRDIEAGRIYRSDVTDGPITKQQKVQEIQDWITKKRRDMLDALWVQEERAKHEAPECRATIEHYKMLRRQRKRELQNTRLVPSEDENTDTDTPVATRPRKRVIFVDSEQDTFSYRIRPPAHRPNRTRIISPTTDEEEIEMIDEETDQED